MQADRKHAVEQLRAVVHHYPVEPGDTLSHRASADAERRGWIRRDGAGRWIPTAKGIRTYNVLPDEATP